MNLQKIREQAEALAKQYNPLGLAPFPYESIIDAHNNLEVIFSDDLDLEVCGAILHKDGIFTILINSNRPEAYQNFTVAHEFGHFFLHQQEVEKNQGIIDSEQNLDKYSQKDSAHLEVEANNLALSLIMPQELVRQVWSVSLGVEDAAELFHVPVVVMSVRLTNLGLVV